MIITETVLMCPMSLQSKTEFKITLQTISTVGFNMSSALVSITSTIAHLDNANGTLSATLPVNSTVAWIGSTSAMMIASTVGWPTNSGNSTFFNFSNTSRNGTTVSNAMQSTDTSSAVDCLTGDTNCSSATISSKATLRSLSSQ
jgi:hypothetical protein